MTPASHLPTDAATEHVVQRGWRLRPEWRNDSRFDRLVDTEFLSHDERQAWQCRTLSRIVRFAAEQVPYYEKLFRSHGVDPGDIKGPAELVALPALTKQTVLDEWDGFRPRKSPKGHEAFSATTSSGTTGPPVSILRSQLASSMFAALKQRELRWFRFEPERLYGALRWTSDLADLSPETSSGETEPQRSAAWPYVGIYFETGPYVAYDLASPVEKQKQWLDTRRPDYLVSYSPALEHLAFAFEDGRRPDYLRGVEAISMQLTPDMERRIQRVFGVPVHQNYGLNEFGMVATMCPMGNRFHIHAEHCLVEIVDEQGKACEPGQLGRILVTTMNNLAMPLIRYDTDDLAVALDGPCPCGRTLPSFGEIRGRYRRFAALPEGALELMQTIRHALEGIPRELMCGLRQFQIHHARDNGFELRLVTTEPLTGAFTGRIEEAFSARAGDRDFSLKIVRVEDIPLPPSGKFQDFVSDYFPAW